MAAAKKKTKSKSDVLKNAISSEKLAVMLKQASLELASTEGADPIECLKSAGLHSPLIIIGSEHVRARRLVSWVRDSFFTEDLKASSSTYFGSELTTTSSVNNVVQTLRGMSLFSRARLITIFNGDVLKASVSDPLVSGLLGADPSCFVILTGEGVHQRTPLLRGIIDKAFVVRIDELRGNKLKRWIEKEARRSGAEQGIAPDAVDLLAHNYGEDTGALAQQLSKLALLTDRENPRITTKTVKAAAEKTPERSSLELVKVIAQKNAPIAVELTHDLVAQGLHPLQLSAFVNRAYRTILAQKSADQSKEIPIKLDPDVSNPWFTRNLAPCQRLFTDKELKAGIETLKDLDLALKSSGVGPNLTLELAVQQLAQRN